MTDLQSSNTSQNLYQYGLCEALPISKERLMELKKNKEKTLLDKKLVKKDA